LRPGWLVLVAALASVAWADGGLVFLAPGGSEVEVRPEPGRPVVVHFWATWCPSCAEDIAQLQRAYADCAGSGVRLYLVNVGDDEEEIRSFAARHPMQLPVLRDPKGEVWRRVDRRGLPMNLFWSTEDRRTEVGPKTEGEWRKALVPDGCTGAGTAAGSDAGAPLLRPAGPPQSPAS
jgi:thiol-disulfide isomerase/thioredoxin